MKIKEKIQNLQNKKKELDRRILLHKRRIRLAKKVFKTVNKFLS